MIAAVQSATFRKNCLLYSDARGAALKCSSCEVEGMGASREEQLMKILFTFAVSSFLLTGCASVPRDAEWVANNLGVGPGDPYKGSVRTLWTPTVAERPGYYTGWSARISWAGTSVGLHVEWNEKDWAFLDRAAIATGQRLPIQVVDRKINHGGSITEKVRVTLDPAFLAAHRQGFNVKLWGDHGEILVKIPDTHVQGLLIGINRDRASSRSRTPSIARSSP